MKRGPLTRKPATGKVADKKKAKKKPTVVLPERPSLSFYEGCEKFYCTNETLKATLEEHGVAIIPSILDKEECQHLERGVWDYFEHITENKMSRDKPESWKVFYDLYPNHSMLIQHWGVGHAQFAWDARQNPKLVELFAQLWGKKAVIGSFDGMSLGLPPEATEKGYYRRGSWLHTDQRLSDSTFQCVQSWVTPLEVRPGDATLIFLRGSHNYHAEFAQRFGYTGEKKDWHKLEGQEEYDFFLKEKNCEHMCIACPAGSLVLWDSRLMHAGIEPLKERPVPNIRMAIYLCYVPRERATPKQLEKKRKAFQELRTTSHWPEKAKLFGKFPQTYGKPLPVVKPIDPPKLTELGKKLAGF